MIKVLLFLVIIYIFSFYLNNKEKFSNNLKNNDNLYLENIIKNNNLILDLAESQIIITKNPDMKYMLRKIIWTLDIENAQIKVALNLLYDNLLYDNKNIVNISNELNPNIKKTWDNYIRGLESNYKNLPIIYTYCQKYNNEKINTVLKNKKDIDFLDSIIDLLNINVNISKNIINNSVNDFILDRANKIIYSFNKNIFLLNNMKNNKFKNQIIM